ncbi:hypothetical protein GOP47_0031180 [Adiantum capillus-veneris]|nr:hypothetical protein GOP47_0031174 [Adiantum capillus-veneris]KAI5053932.1 hypothetical protein GOP47_0031177 [Adiantum capillus-veneris]KAI5053935.1 hypothetical protein GOP47_0031180 [Adiantum capillus-veneris]
MSGIASLLVDFMWRRGNIGGRRALEDEILIKNDGSGMNEFVELGLMEAISFDSKAISVADEDGAGGS